MHNRVRIQNRNQVIGIQYPPQHICNQIRQDSHQEHTVIPLNRRHFFRLLFPQHIPIDNDQDNRSEYSYNRISHTSILLAALASEFEY